MGNKWLNDRLLENQTLADEASFLPQIQWRQIIKFAPRCKFWITVIPPTTQERGKRMGEASISLFKCATITLKFIQFRKQLVSKCDGKKRKKNPVYCIYQGLLTHLQMVQLTSAQPVFPPYPLPPRHSRLWATPDSSFLSFYPLFSLLWVL